MRGGSVIIDHGTLVEPAPADGSSENAFSVNVAGRFEVGDGVDLGAAFGVDHIAVVVRRHRRWTA
jgi:hypothetical protein